MSSHPRLWLSTAPLVFVSLVFSSVVIVGCQSIPGTTKAAGAMPPPAVAVMEVSAQDVPIFSEYAAQTFARDMVEVRGRVDGYIEKRLFETGSDVQAGQALYILDLRPYEADVQRLRGEVSEGDANKEFASKQVALLQAAADLAQ